MSLSVLQLFLLAVIVVDERFYKEISRICYKILLKQSMHLHCRIGGKVVMETLTAFFLKKNAVHFS